MRIDWPGITQAFGPVTTLKAVSVGPGLRGAERKWASSEEIRRCVRYTRRIYEVNLAGRSFGAIGVVVSGESCGSCPGYLHIGRDQGHGDRSHRRHGS